MQEEVTQKTVTFCIRATKITADLLKKVLVAYLRHQRQKSVEKKAQKNQPKQGKVTVKELAKQNAGMVNIEITDKNIKSFDVSQLLHLRIPILVFFQFFQNTDK